VDDPLGKALDVIGVNEYIGWYEQHRRVPTLRMAHRLSEAADRERVWWGAKAGLLAVRTNAGPKSTRPISTASVRNAERIPQLRGMSPWVLMDFRSPNRPLVGIQDEFNRKGLVSEQGRRSRHSYSAEGYTERPSASRNEVPR